MFHAPWRAKASEFDLFPWTSPDGSSVWHTGSAIRIAPRLTPDEDTRPDEAMPTIAPLAERCSLRWQPGGGPTIKNIEALRRLRESGRADVIFCDPGRFFDDVEKLYGSEIPAYTDDLQHHASGCYSAVSEIKTLNRRGEMELLAAEVYSALAANLIGTKMPNERLEYAWHNVCFNHFHDTLGGCSIREAYDDARMFGYESLAIAAKIENAALQSISWAVDTMKFHTPIFVFNPHPWEVTQLVRVNHRYRGGVTAPDGTRVPAQYIRSSSEPCTGSQDVIFVATVPAYGFTVYDVHGEPDTQPAEGVPRGRQCAKMRICV